ncbi:MAG: hypothetical protein EA412_03575 [Chitinophagaceae bacterium]|nr:MAG: hypothetical protein EA412_03575 [Chitinophagaceae bacterium]
MTFKPVSLLILLLFCVSEIFAQRITTENVPNRAKRFYNESTEHLNWDRYKEAAENLERAVNIFYEFPEAHFRLGFTYLELHEYEKAAKSFDYLAENFPDVHPGMFFGLGEARFHLNKFDEAEEAFNLFLEKGRHRGQLEEAKKRINNITFAREAIKNPVPFNPIQLDEPVNTELSEYFPALTVDSRFLIFTRMDMEGNFPVENLYIAERVDNKWGKVYPVGPPVNTYENEGAHCISPDGRFIFFTACNRPGNLGNCDIYVAERRGERWSRPQNLGPVVNSTSWDGHPSISPDGRKLFFSSTRSGGFGGQDIWVSTLSEKGEWQKPENLGPEINTSGDERTPFIHFDNQTLYFASDGLPGMGGFDVFKTQYVDGKWAVPVNLGYPINSAGNDMGLFVSATADTAYIASDRFGKPDLLDIFYFELYEEMRPNPSSWISGRVLDKVTRKPVQASVEIRNIENAQMVAAVTSDPADGSFLISLPLGGRYAYHAKAENYLFYSESFDVTDSDKKSFDLEILLPPLDKGAEIVLRNIFFDHDKYDLTEQSTLELELLADLMKVNPELHIEIQGHTDNTGNAAYNKTLSEKRAESVRNYLLKTGDISSERLTYKGFGQENPIADNSTEEGRAQNRRTSIKILE